MLMYQRIISNILLQHLQMSVQKKQWLPEQDRALKYLRCNLKIGKWSVIGQKMADQYRMPRRSGKQCRQRYQNYLDDNIVKTGWTKQQETKMFKLHDKIGNKWALIAEKITGRTDNCIKNHFYSKLRKSLRKLNKIIHQQFRKKFKQIRIILIYKIIEANEQNHKQNSMCNEQFYQFCRKLKNNLLEYAEDNMQNSWEGNPQKSHQILCDINEFNKLYKRQSKNTHKKNLNLLNVSVEKPRKQSSSSNSNDEQQENSLVSSDLNENSKDDEQQNEFQQMRQHQKDQKVQKRKANDEIKIKSGKKVQVDDNPKNFSFTQNGFPQNEYLPPLIFLNRNYSKPSKISEKQHDQQLYFEESEFNIKLTGYNPFANVKKCSDIQQIEQDIYYNNG